MFHSGWTYSEPQSRMKGFNNWRLSQIDCFGTIRVDKAEVNIWNKVTTLLMNQAGHHGHGRVSATDCLCLSHQRWPTRFDQPASSATRRQPAADLSRIGLDSTAVADTRLAT